MNNKLENLPKFRGKASYEGLFCPCCDSNNINAGSTSTTLVGWAGGPEKDPNHWEQYAVCFECGEKFTKHWVIADMNSWYTIGKHVVRGEASCCCSNFKKKCQEDDCPGWQSHLISLSGLGFYRYGYTEDDKYAPGQPMGWKCTTCETLSPDERWGDEYLYEGAKLK